MTANVNVTKVLFKRGNTAQNAAYTGINGEITVDTQAKTLRIHDGVTVGGNIVTAGAIASYLPTDPTITSIQANVAAANAAISAITGIDTSLIANAATQQTQIDLLNANVAAANTLIPNLLAVSGNVLPAANVTYSLGSEQFQWKDLWVSNNTIYIGNTPIGVDGGTLLVNGAPVSLGFDQDLNTTDNVTFANILFPGGSTYSNNTFISPTSNGVLNTYEWKFSDQTIGNDTITLQWNLLDTTLSQWYLSTNGQTKYFVLDGESQSLGFNGGSGDSGTVTFGATTNNGAGGANDIELTTVTGNAYIRTGSNSWKFNQSGDLIFPDATVQTTAWTGTVNFGNTIAIGYNTGTVSQGSKAVAVGSTAGNVSQGTGAVAVGDRSGVTSQGNLTVAVGSQAGEISQGLQATAVGSGAGNYNQGAGTVAIGTNAGAFNQGLRATAIGSLAGASGQGEYAVAIGNFAGGTNQANNSIIINATGSSLDQTIANTFTVKPIRNAAGSTVLYYDSGTGEITHDAGYGNVQVAEFLENYTGAINFTASPAIINNVGTITTVNANVTTLTATSAQTGNLTIAGNAIQQSAYYETYSNVTTVGGNLTCNFVNSGTFYASLTANVTVNFTNVVQTPGTIVGATVIVDQGVTPYQISNVQINGGSVQTVKWAGGVGQNPGTGSNTDVMSFSLINLGSGAWRVLGQISNYG